MLLYYNISNYNKVLITFREEKGSLFDWNPRFQVNPLQSIAFQY